MRTTLIAAMLFAATLAAMPTAALAEPPKMTVDENNFIHVNGKKTLLIATWLQPEEYFGMWKDLGINWFIAGFHPHKGGTINQYLAAADKHDVFVSIGYRWAVNENMLQQVMNHPRVLTMHHPDEPDKPAVKSDAQIDKGKLKPNSSCPLHNMLDGNLRSTAVIDPPHGESFTIKLEKPATVTTLAMAFHTGSYSVPTEVEFLADGTSILKATLENKQSLQQFTLDKHATFTSLTVSILASEKGRSGFVMISEVQALDAQGNNVLLSKTWVAPRITPQQTMADYKAIKQADPNRIVSLTLMARFMEQVRFQKIPLDVYKEFPPTTDLLMFDLYPWSVYKGKNLHWNADGLKQLRALAGPSKALGIWLQSSDAESPGDPGMTPNQMRANVWLALAHGATFIAYYPQSEADGFKFNHINAERRAALKAVNEEITKLSDLILTPAQDDLFTVKHDGHRVDVMQRRDGNNVMLVLVNVIEEGEGKDVTVTVTPNKLKLTDTPVRHRTQQPLSPKDAPWTITLKPWETAVITATAAE